MTDRLHSLRRARRIAAVAGAIVLLAGCALGPYQPTTETLSVSLGHAEGTPRDSVIVTDTVPEMVADARFRFPTAAFTEQPTVGSVIVVNDVSSGGLVLEVTAVDPDPAAETVSVTVSRGSVASVFEELDVLYVHPVSAADATVVQTSPGLSLQSVTPSATVQSQMLTAPFRRRMAALDVSLPEEPQAEFIFAATEEVLYQTDGFSVVADGSLGVALTYGVDLQVKRGELVSAAVQVVTEPTISLSLDARAEGDISLSDLGFDDDTVDLVTFNLSPITFFIGPVPVIIAQQLTIVAELAGSISGSAGVQFSLSTRLEGGFSYEQDDGFVPIRAGEGITADTVRGDGSAWSGALTPCLSADARLTASIGPVYTTRIYGLAGPYATVYPYLTLAGTAAADDQGAAVHGEVLFGIAGRTGFEVTIPGIEPLVFGGTRFEVLNEPISLFSGSFATEWQQPVAPAPEPGDGVPPGPPSAVEATASVGTVRLTWTDPPDDDLMFIKIFGNGWTSEEHVVYPGVEELAITGVRNDRTYSYRLEAWDTSGEISTETVTVTATPRFRGWEQVVTAPAMAAPPVVLYRDTEGWVFGTGGADSGELGARSGSFLHPTLISVGPVVDVARSYRMSAFVDDTGLIYLSGVFGFGADIRNAFEPLPGITDAVDIADASSGYYPGFVVVHRDGTVSAVTDLSDGIGTRATIAGLSDIVRVAAKHSTQYLAVDDSGYAWYSYTDWDYDSQQTVVVGPTRLTDPGPVAEVAVSSTNNAEYAVVTADGALWYWGDRNHDLTEAEVTELSNVVDAYVDNGACIAVTADGTVWMVPGYYHDPDHTENLGWRYAAPVELTAVPDFARVDRGFGITSANVPYALSWDRDSNWYPLPDTVTATPVY